MCASKPHAPWDLSTHTPRRTRTEHDTSTARRRRNDTTALSPAHTPLTRQVSRATQHMKPYETVTRNRHSPTPTRAHTCPMLIYRASRCHSIVLSSHARPDAIRPNPWIRQGANPHLPQLLLCKFIGQHQGQNQWHRQRYEVSAAAPILRFQTVPVGLRRPSTRHCVVSDTGNALVGGAIW